MTLKRPEHQLAAAKYRLSAWEDVRAGKPGFGPDKAFARIKGEIDCEEGEGLEDE